MTHELTDTEVAAALDTCNQEPVHIPGVIQPFGWLVASDRETGLVRYASANMSELLGHPVETILGTPLRDVLGPEVWHGLRNLAQLPDNDQQRQNIGSFECCGAVRSFHGFESSGCHVIEIDPGHDSAPAPEIMRDQAYLVDRIQACTDEQALLDLTVKLMRYASGFDRVMIYKFDHEFNGQVVAEARKASLEPMLNLRFPHWDIPEQARALMLRFPLRIISDVDQTPSPVLKANPSDANLDLSIAHLRGVSPIHMQYLRNMGVAGSMTLSIVLGGKLWGIISFHHGSAKTPTQYVRELLTGFLTVFRLKIELLREQESMALARRTDALQIDIQHDFERTGDLAEIFSTIGPTVCEVLEASGAAIQIGSEWVQYGKVPDQSTLEALRDLAREGEDGLLLSESLAELLPGHAADLAGCSGVLMSAVADNRVICVFREEIQQSVSWAGNPEKTIETIGGQSRLQPRGSFSVYVRSVEGRCAPWTDDNTYMMRRMRLLLNSAERRVFTNNINRHQTLMINELNHRVRNILALVKSVSRQARSSQGSFESYSKALEMRIQALAAAHDIGAGSAVSAVSINRIIVLEGEPYFDDDMSRLVINGPDRSVGADAAPLFALVTHELMTNAAKYGALSNSEGRLEIDLREDPNGLTIDWRETGGPTVIAPSQAGFGTSLIQQAIPYEMGGTAEVDFRPEGVRAVIHLPSEVLDQSRGLAPARETPLVLAQQRPDVPTDLLAGQVLVLEDNFMIATGMRSELEELGFDDVETTSNNREALAFLETTRPNLAILDINLGGGKTSAQTALRLQELGVPFIFVTGYGDAAVLLEELRGHARLTKPVTKLDLQNALSKLQAGA